MPMPVIDVAPGNEDAPQRPSIPLVVVWAVAVLGALSGVLWIHDAVVSLRGMLHLVDLDVYRSAADRVVHGVSVYDTPLRGHARGNWEFVYTPFAALLLTPLAGLHGSVFTWVGGLGNFALLTGSVWLTVWMLGYRRDRRMLIVGPTAAALLLLCLPIRQTMAFGQINILLMLLVLADMALPDSARLKGVGTGIATGIKLTPGFFILYLLVTRRFRAAATAIGALAATIGLGFAVLPRDSLTFWAGGFIDPSRVGVPINPENETLRGGLARALGTGDGVQLLWLAAALASAAIGLILARRLSKTGAELPAVVLCGLTSTLVSPFSWIHHWVWLAPLLIYLVHLTYQRRSVAGAAVLLAVFVVSSGGFLVLIGVPHTSFLYYPDHGLLALVDRNAYIWLTLALFAAAMAAPVSSIERTRSATSCA